MGFTFKVVEPQKLPEGTDWALVRSDGETYFFVTAARVAATTAAWEKLAS